MQQELFSEPSLTVCDPAPRPPLHYLPIYKVTLVHEAAISIPRPQLRSSKDVAEVLQRFLKETDREHFLVILLDRKNRLIGINTVSIGSLTASIVHPREVFKAAILANAAALICGHNHPSGDPQPSQEDRVLTARLVAAGQLLGIEVLDHLVLGDGTTDYFSFGDAGLIHQERER
jgi:DNA repair protein RadC